MLPGEFDQFFEIIPRRNIAGRVMREVDDNQPGVGFQQGFRVWGQGTA